ncbi:hypothetical protein QRO08_22570 [Paracidovorax citrulli]|uniref:Uncharacterized protein n=2 Tax=Paracidovorax citrulli TaxID=80869 RepID=A1TJE1_PARC0|nr:hypothetical protein [Paracidovorax citrulli]ABM31079.1 hypothetical protein Aave_0472 [Paracidovorax citrulli AAC00-1]ACU00246.1 hypothetical protein [Paracidovorax citrulli]ATG95770.1 hypothetical protein CQB05_18475 [Paracidovorax citrulli]MVT29627.1 hypothetical protein [Paracidovorax citrulli]MVT37943.1 hypothetical protein [Paracidovorax citrulli]
MTASIESTIFSDLENLEQALSEDLSGDRARAMIRYFDEVARESSAMRIQAEIDAERQLIGQLVDAFQVSQRVIRKIWETLHGTTLAV